MKKKSNRKKITPALDTFAGIKLEPMTKQREVVAAEMGMRYGFVGQYRSQFYLRDSIIVVWLRTLPVETTQKSPWSVDRAEVETEEAMKEALKWAGRMNIGIRGPRFMEAWRIFLGTMKQIAEAKGEPIIPDEDKADPPPSEGEL